MSDRLDRSGGSAAGMESTPVPSKSSASAPRARGVKRLLLDVSSLMYRAFFSLPTSMSGEDRRPVNAVHGYLDWTAQLVRARQTHDVMHAFDANWLSLQAEVAEASVLIGEATFAATLDDRLAPYAGRPVTAGRAVCSYGAVDRTLGGLAALLGRRDDAVRHLEDAVRINDAIGCVVWRARAERDLSQLVRDGGSSAEPPTWAHTAFMPESRR